MQKFVLNVSLLALPTTYILETAYFCKVYYDISKGTDILSYDTRFSCNLRPIQRRLKKFEFTILIRN